MKCVCCGFLKEINADHIFAANEFCELFFVVYLQSKMFGVAFNRPSKTRECPLFSRTSICADCIQKPKSNCKMNHTSRGKK